MEGAPLLIRAGLTADAAAIAEVHVRTWQIAYRGLIPDSYLDAIDPAERRDRWQQITQQAEFGGQCLLVAQIDGNLVGFATGGAARDAEPVADHEVYAIYVDPSAWGLGAADALMSRLLEDLQPSGAAVYLWVLTGNARARRFYARHGFQPAGTVRVETFDRVPVEETLMVRRSHEATCGPEVGGGPRP